MRHIAGVCVGVRLVLHLIQYPSPSTFQGGSIFSNQAPAKHDGWVPPCPARDAPLMFIAHTAVGAVKYRDLTAMSLKH